MKIEIINVGTELLLGEIINTNAATLEKFCKELGFDVYYQSVVGDNPQRIKDCLELAFHRGADCVITTGGLGPTQDDLTKELSAEYLGLEMILWEDEKIKVRDKCQFVSNSLNIPENNYKQAYFPVNAIILENEVGTANGCIMSKDEKMIINLPGPPKELNYILENSLKPIMEKYRKEVLYSEEIVTMGIGESRVSEVLSELIDQQNEVSIAMYASEEYVRIRLACKGMNQKEAYDKIEPIKQDIHKILSGYILSNNLKEELDKLMPSYEVIYKDDFRLREGYLNQSQLDGKLKIVLSRISLRLGDKISIDLYMKDRKHSFEVYLLKKAEYSYSKLEAKMTYHIVKFLR